METTETTGLTKMDLKALQTAGDFYFGWIKGDSYIRCRKEVATSDPFENPVREYRIPVDVQFTNYEEDGPRGPAKSCGEHVPGYNEHIQTIVSLLRVGDRLTIKWSANNSSLAMKDAGWVQDFMELIVERGPEAKSTRLVFHVADSITSPGSICRMIKY